MILSIGNQQYEYTNMLLQKFSLQITLFLSEHKKFSPETFAVHDIIKLGTAKNVIPCTIIRLDLRKLILSMQNTLLILWYLSPYLYVPYKICRFY